MSELKTKKNDTSVNDFINGIGDEEKREDAKKLLNIFEQVTGEKPAMWGSAIIGFGLYHYKSERSSQEGDWPLTGFSPRKAAFSLYIMAGFDNYKDILKNLGKFKISGGSCLYVKKLSDVDYNLLKKLIKMGYLEMKKRYSK